MAFLFWPDADALRRAGYGLVAKVPCVFEADWTYHKVASRYLRERALVEWTPSHATPLGFTRGIRRPTRASLLTFGDSLCNFLEWCVWLRKDWRKVDFLSDILDGYQKDMLESRWSTRGKGLAARTVNLRVHEACNYLTWAASRNLRKTFVVPTTTRLVNVPSARSSIGHRPRIVESQMGRVRPDPKSLQMPRDEQIRKWLNSVRVERGQTKALMCELIIQSAIRRQEAAQWRVDTLPEDPDAWKIVGDYVEVIIRHGTKGSKSTDENGDEVGPPRQIAIPLTMAMRLHKYRELVRPAQWANYVRAASDEAEKRRRMRDRPRRLFLSDHNGQPVSHQLLYEAWSGVSYVPCKGWSPHLGRHFWACKTLMSRLAQEAKNQSDADVVMHGGHFRMSALDILMTVIQPQLGHVSAETSELYLVWVQRALTLKSLHDEYEAELESFVSE